MLKYTKYFIEKVRKEDGVIIRVKTLSDEFSVGEVVKHIENNIKFVVKVGNDEIPVRVVLREGKKYIRTFKDEKPTNNLENLPLF